QDGGSTPNQLKQKHREGQRAIARLGKPIRVSIAVAQVLTLLSAVVSVAPYAALIKLGDLLLDAYHHNHPVDAPQAKHVLMLLIGAYCLRLVLYFAALMVTHLADLRLRAINRRILIDRIGHAPLSHFTESSSGALRKAVQDDTITAHVVIAHGPVDKINAIATPMALVIFAFCINWRLGLLSLATLPLYVFTYSFSLRGMSEKTAEMDGKLADVSSTMAEFVSGITVVKAFGKTGEAHGNYLAAGNEFSRFYRAWCMPLISVSCLAMSWVSIPVLLIVNFGVGALLINSGHATMPEVLATSLIALVIPATVIALANVEWAYQLAGSAAVRLCKWMDTPILPQPSNPQQPEGNRIVIDNVSYGYGEVGSPQRVEALKEVSLVLEPGTVTALVGASGSGKTTLASLVARFADPEQGDITIGGVSLRKMDETTLYEQVSFVLQDAQLLNISIHDNIALTKPEASREEIRAAAKSANIDDFIMALPDGYDTILGTDTALSGGQEQRIAIARAIIKDAPVLVLDEATALADAESEAEIQQALSRLVQGKTVLVIAHRLASIRGAHQIAVMEHGRISAVGQHEQLLAEPHYQALLKQGEAITPLRPQETSHV
ncbi:MAG: ABC transporter ATP-binding protein, partial [Propionibacteriaceae bacterium]